MSHLTLGGYHSHFTDEEPKAQIGKVTDHHESDQPVVGPDYIVTFLQHCHLLLIRLGAL